LWPLCFLFCIATWNTNWKCTGATSMESSRTMHFSICKCTEKYWIHWENVWRRYWKIYIPYTEKKIKNKNIYIYTENILKTYRKYTEIYTENIPKYILKIYRKYTENILKIYRKYTENILKMIPYIFRIFSTFSVPFPYVFRYKFGTFSVYLYTERCIFPGRFRTFSVNRKPKKYCFSVKIFYRDVKNW